MLQRAENGERRELINTLNLPTAPSAYPAEVKKRKKKTHGNLIFTEAFIIFKSKKHILYKLNNNSNITKPLCHTIIYTNLLFRYTWYRIFSIYYEISFASIFVQLLVRFYGYDLLVITKAISPILSCLTRIIFRKIHVKLISPIKDFALQYRTIVIF